jgi:hypothetical protein
MRIASVRAALLVVPFAAACGGGDGPQRPDGPQPPANPGFILPTAGTQAYDNRTLVGPADWSCLGTPTDDAPTAVEITLSGLLTDFQNSDNEINAGTISAFRGIDYQNPVDTDGPTDLTGAYSLTLPTGTTRWGFKLSAPDYMDTFLLNQYFDPNQAEQSQNISGISNSVATALPAIIGLRRTDGTGVLAGAMRDCSGHEVAGAIATVSATAGEQDHLTGAQTYYLTSNNSLPARHDQLAHTDTNGLFAVFELPVTAATYIQVWGFPTDADVTGSHDDLTLLAELRSPVVGDTVITGSFEPLRQ